MQKVIFISVHPIHYNDYLFSEIYKSGVPFQVYYSNQSLENYPWKQKIMYSFDYHNCHYFLGIDWNLVSKALWNKETLLIVAGWESFFKNFLYLILILTRRKFIVFTDTIKVDQARKPLKAYIRDKWLDVIMDHAHRILTTGEVGVEQMKRQYKKNNNKIKNFPFATDLKYFNTRPEYKDYSQKKRIFSSGRLLNFHKGHDFAIRAMAILKNEGWDFEYVIAGTGPDETMLKNLIEELGLQNHVKLLGWQELDSLRQNYAQAHIFLHPSHFDPFPNAILEAMASGLVVVASDKAGSAVERIINGKSGFIFEDNNMEGLLENLRQLFKFSEKEVSQISAEALMTAQQWNVAFNINVLKEAIA